MEDGDEISRIEIINMLGHGILAGAGELSQSLVRGGHMDYNWLVGHLSDYAGIAALTAYPLLFAKRTKTKIISTLVIPTIYSVLETLPLVSGVNTVYDPQDIACYFGGALVALGVKELASRLKSKKEGKLERITNDI